MILVQGNGVLKYVSDGLGVYFDEKQSFAIGVLKDSDLIVGVVYNNFRYHSGVLVNVEMSIYSTSKEWCKKRVLAEIFAFPFISQKASRVQATLRKSDKKTRKFVERLGFKLEGVHPCAYDGKQTAISYGMLKDDCRWLNGKT